MSGSIIFFVLGTFAVAWMATVVFVLTLCRMAALADSVDAPRDQSPRRPSTWGTVRKRIFTSPQSDQFATYK
jgi:hypothetical protein